MDPEEGLMVTGLRVLRTPGAKAADGCGAVTAVKQMTATGEHRVWSRRMKGGVLSGESVLV